MAKAAVTESPNQGTESFAALLDESLGQARSLEGAVLRGRVVAIENDAALVDVGLKSEGRVPLKEFAAPGQRPEIKIGDTVEVYLERMEDKNGEAMLSREIKLATKVDPSLLGDLIVKVGSRLIDSSLRTKLEGMRMVMRGA